MGATSGFQWLFGPILGPLSNQVGNFLDRPAAAAREAANKQQDAQDKLYSEAKAKTNADKSAADSIATRDAARAKQRAAAASATGRQDTILTGPLGLTDQYSGQRKTLLGT